MISAKDSLQEPEKHTFLFVGREPTFAVSYWDRFKGLWLDFLYRSNTLKNS